MSFQRKTLVTGFEARSVALIASWTLAGAALAQNMPTTPPATDGAAVSTPFQKIDRNGDGQISREEAAALPALAAEFDRLDADANGSLNAEEFAKAARG